MTKLKKSFIFFLIYFIINTISYASEFLRLKHMHQGIDPEFRDTVNYFYYLTNASKGNVTIGFVDEISLPFNDIILGTTNRVIFGGFEIDVNRMYWHQLSVEERDFLILHELGHAVCKLSHSDYNDNPAVRIMEIVLVLLGQMKIKEPFIDGCASDIMTTLIPPTNCIRRHYFSYILSLQKGCSK